MEFMGKWIIYSYLVDGNVGPGYTLLSDTLVLGLVASARLGSTQPGLPANLDVFNIYAAPNGAGMLLQSDCLFGGTCTFKEIDNPGVWVRCDSAVSQLVSVTFTGDVTKASPLTQRDHLGSVNLIYNSTPLYFKIAFLTLAAAVLGFPGPSGSNPDLKVTVKTQPLATYRQAKSAAGADFSNIDFRGVNLSGIDFTGADFSGAYMNGQTVLPPGTVLRKATFTGAHLEGVHLEGCDLSGADFTETSLAGVHFDTKTNFTGARFNGDDLSNLTFSDFELTGADFTGATLNGLDLQGAKLSGAIMPEQDLTLLAPATFKNPPTLAGTSAKLTTLTNAKVPAALLNGDWQWTDLRNATIPDLPHSVTKLRAAGARLSGLNKNVLTGLSLCDAVFDNAVMDGLGLSGADLTGASLIGASLHGTTLTNVKLVRAHLTGAQLGTLSRLFQLPLSAEAALNSGQVAPLAPLFKQQGISLSSDASIEVLAANRVWQLNDAGNHVVYTVRLETGAGGARDLLVYGPAVAATLIGAYMPDAVLTGVNLYEVLASSIQFYGVGDGVGARLDGSAILEEAQLNDANLSNLNLTQAQLMGTNLSGADLFNAKFNKANLSPSARGLATNLSRANLQGADFTDALLYGADLTNAAVAINVPTRAFPKQGGVYLFSLPYPGDKHALQQYTAELDAASTLFSLNPGGDQTALQKYLTALKTNNVSALKVAFLKHQPPIVLSDSAQIQTVEPDAVWQIVDGQKSYTLWTDPDEQGETELYAAPSMTDTRAAFHQNDMTLRWQASASIDAAGQQWLIDNDSENPQNFSTGYVKFLLKLNGSLLDVYGAAVRVERLGDSNKLEMDTETCNVTTLGVANMNGETVCPNGTKLSVNQAQSGKSWDVQWLRAPTPPAPPTCVPTDYSWCAHTSDSGS